MRNKKAIFITLTAIILLSIILVISFIAMKNERTAYKKNVIKSKFMMQDNLVDRLVDRNIPFSLEQTLKQSLIKISELVINGTYNKTYINLTANLTEVIKTGNLSNVIIAEPSFKERIDLIHSLNYLRDINYNVSLINLTFNQTDYRTINFDFWINYSINFTDSFYTKLFNDNKDIFVYGFWTENGTITSKWKENSSNNTCYLSEISSIYSCGNTKQIYLPS